MLSPCGIGEVPVKAKAFPVDRTGTTFHTPLSTGSWHVNYIRASLKNFVEDFCSKIDLTECQRMTVTYHGMVESPNFVLSQARIFLRTSYSNVHNSLRKENCKVDFCRQLSGQLAECKKCQRRPILYLIIKDEASMQQHLNEHKDETDERNRLYKLLMSTLVKPQSLGPEVYQQGVLSE